MSEYQNSGILFPNRYKRSNPKAPDYTGTATVTCTHCGNKIELEATIWKRNGAKGEFLTLRVTPKAEAEAKRLAAKAAKSGLPVETAQPSETPSQPKDDDVPF